jgi:hypothetical protein
MHAGARPVSAIVKAKNKAAISGLEYGVNFVVHHAGPASLWSKGNSNTRDWPDTS